MTGGNTGSGAGERPGHLQLPSRAGRIVPGSGDRHGAGLVAVRGPGDLVTVGRPAASPDRVGQAEVSVGRDPDGYRVTRGDLHLVAGPVDVEAGVLQRAT